jgi:hypothetical protein
MKKIALLALTITLSFIGCFSYASSGTSAPFWPGPSAIDMQSLINDLIPFTQQNPSNPAAFPGFTNGNLYLNSAQISKLQKNANWQHFKKHSTDAATLDGLTALLNNNFYAFVVTTAYKVPLQNITIKDIVYTNHVDTGFGPSTDHNGGYQIETTNPGNIFAYLIK